MSVGREQKKNKTITFRITESSLDNLREKSKEFGVSINGYISLLLNLPLAKQEISFEERTIKPEKKEVKNSIYFTKNEAEILKRYARSNDWSMHKEIRYRIISSLSEKPKLTKEELRLIYSVRSSINVLGSNLNSFLINKQILLDDGVILCTELLSLIKQIKDKINYLEKCSYSNFKLKEIGAEKNVR